MTILNKKQFILQGSGRYEIFGYQPDNVSKNKWGYLYLLGGINQKISSNDPNFYLLNSIASVLKKEYYANYHNNYQAALEHALKKINGIINASEYRYAFEIIIIVIQGNNITFTKIGNIQVLLVRNGKLFNLNKVSQESQQASHSASVKNENSTEPQTSTLFKNIIRGKLQEKDKIVALTEQGRNLLKNEFFIARLAKRPFNQIEDFISKNFGNSKKKAGIAVMQIEIEKISSSMSNPIIKYKNIQNNNTKPNNNLVNSSHESLNDFVAPDQTTKSKKLNIKNYINSKKPYLKKSIITLKTIGSFIYKYIIKIKNIVTNFTKEKIIKIKTPTLYLKKNSSNFKKNNYYKVTLLRFFKNKYTIISIIVIAVIVTGTIIINNGNKKIENNAKNNVTNTENVNNSPVQENIMPILGKDFTEISQFNNLPIDAIGATVINNAIIIYQKDKVYKIDTATNNTKLTLTNSSFNNDTFKHNTKLDEDNIIFISDNKSILNYNTQNDSFYAQAINWPLSTNTIFDVKSFNNNIYLLGSDNIIKYSFKNDILSTPSKWLKSDTTISRPISLAIDGSIFVLDNLGNINEFLKGRKINELANTGVTSQNAQIITQDGWNNLYLFDPVASKIIIIDKITGDIIYNIQEPFLSRILYITPQKQESSLLIIDKKGIYSINLDQINK